jgi:hypothetical protein
MVNMGMPVKKQLSLSDDTMRAGLGAIPACPACMRIEPDVPGRSMSAEFLVSPSSPDKISLYDRFIDLFYEVFREDNIERHTIAYENGFLPAMRLSPAGNTSKGTIVIHGGFDSLIEEFYCFWTFFTGAGYEVIAFEGPG